MQNRFPTRPRIPLSAPGQPTLALQTQHPSHSADIGAEVLYVHGSTFGADMVIFFRFDGRSWADALNSAGNTVWCFDRAGYVHSERYPQDVTIPVGCMPDVLPQLYRMVTGRHTRDSAVWPHRFTSASVSIHHARRTVSQPPSRVSGGAVPPSCRRNTTITKEFA